MNIYDVIEKNRVKKREEKSIKNKNLIKVLECFRDEDKTIEIEEYVNGKRLDDYFREKRQL